MHVFSFDKIYFIHNRGQYLFLLFAKLEDFYVDKMSPSNILSSTHYFSYFGIALLPSVSCINNSHLVSLPLRMNSLPMLSTLATPGKGILAINDVDGNLVRVEITHSEHAFMGRIKWPEWGSHYPKSFIYRCACALPFYGGSQLFEKLCLL